MNANEAIKKELQTHRAKLFEHQSELYEIEQSVEKLQATHAELRDKAAFERGVIQSLEFATTIIEQGQNQEEK